MTIIKSWGALTALALCLAGVNSAFAASSENGPCAVDSSWFSGKTIPEPQPEVFPDKPNNCDFHRISWQYFLWLTEKQSDGKLRLETLFSEDAINPESPEAVNKNLHLAFQAGSLGILVDPQ